MPRLEWNIDPVLLHVGLIQIRWYGLLFAAGILAAYRAGVWSFEQAGGSREEASRLLGYVVAGTIIGARLGHCLLYEPAYYLSHPLEILAVWRGGLASHGGILGIALAVWLFARRTGRDVLWLLDRVAVAAPVAAACIRVGNFFNSEIVGRPSTVPWAVVFARLDPYPRHPAMLYEATAYLVIFARCSGSSGTPSFASGRARSRARFSCWSSDSASQSSSSRSLRKRSRPACPWTWDNS